MGVVWKTDAPPAARAPAAAPEPAAAATAPAAAAGPSRAGLFDKHYFNGGGKVGGYAREGYWDFPPHEVTAHHVLARAPKSALELGCARGYVLKRVQDAGVPAAGVEISRHCHMTRACENLFLRDVCADGLPDAEAALGLPGGYDLAYSVATFEHIPEQHLPHVLGELKRVSRRGLHGIDFGHNDDGFDKTHCCLKPQSWWRELFDRHGLQSHEVVDKEDLEKPGPGFHWPDIFAGDGRVKLNLGSFTQMFHRGWTNVDVHDLQGFAQHYNYKYLRHDVRNGLPFGTGAVDLIYTSHMLEHLSYDDGLRVLRECRRVLRPGGAARVIVPDARLLMSLYYDDVSNNGAAGYAEKLAEFAEINDGVAAAPTPAGRLWALLHEGHAACYDWETLRDALARAGFAAYRVGFRCTTPAAPGGAGGQILRETVDPFPCLSLYVEAHPSLDG